MGQRREMWQSDDGEMHESEEAMVEHEANVETRERAEHYASYAISTDKPNARTRVVNIIVGYERWRREGERERAAEAAE